MYLHMAIPYLPVKLKSANIILAVAILGSTTKLILIPTNIIFSYTVL